MPGLGPRLELLCAACVAAPKKEGLLPLAVGKRSLLRRLCGSSKERRAGTRDRILRQLLLPLWLLPLELTTLRLIALPCAASLLPRLRPPKGGPSSLICEWHDSLKLLWRMLCRQTHRESALAELHFGHGSL